jgi:hypothetical protein
MRFLWLALFVPSFFFFFFFFLFVVFFFFFFDHRRHKVSKEKQIQPRKFITIKLKMQAALEAAKQTLNFKKRFIVSALEDKSSRAADDAVSRVEQFEQELAKHAEAVASDPAYDKELRDFLAKAKTDAAIKKNVADAEYKVQSWRSVIRRTESSLDDELKNPRGYCNPKEWERVLSEKREFQPLPELESLCKDWSSFIAEFPEMEKKIVGKLRAVELAGEWRNEGGVLEGWVTRSLPRDIRNARENPSPRNADTLQKCVENAKVRWGFFVCSC